MARSTLCAYHSNDATVAYARTRHPHVLPTRRRSLINDDSALLRHCLDTRSTCPALAHVFCSCVRSRFTRARHVYELWQNWIRDERRNVNFQFFFCFSSESEGVNERSFWKKKKKKESFLFHFVSFDTFLNVWWYIISHWDFIIEYRRKLFDQSFGYWIIELMN